MFILSEKASHFSHNHMPEKNIKKKVVRKSMEEFIKSCSKSKSVKTSEMIVKLEDKFGQKMNYQAIANVQRNIDEDLFGEPAEDAEVMKNILINLKNKLPDFLGEILKDEKTNKLRAMVFASPRMKELAQNFMDLVVMDTTFGTNRFRMKSITLCGKDNNNKTIIFSQGLIAQETKELFSWILNETKNYFNVDPKFVLIDADPALIGAVELTYPTANLKVCGWHTENNFKNHLFGSKKSKHFFFNLLILLELEKIEDDISKQNIYEIAINLPYILNEKEFNRRYELLLTNVVLSPSQLKYFQKMQDKKERWAFAFNKENSLGSHCTGMVENINRLHKAHVGLKCGLSEYLYRTILFSTEFNNKNEISPEDLLQYNTYFSLMKGSSYVLLISDHVTSFALKTIVINMMKSFSWKPFDDKDGVFKADKNHIKFIFTETDSLLLCSCNYQKVMKLPCEHILRILTEKKKEESILDYIGQRWRSEIQFQKEDEVLEELKILIEEEKLKKIPKIKFDQDEESKL